MDNEVENRDMYETNNYKVFFEDSVTEEYEEFVYLISRGKYEEVVDIASSQNFPLNAELRPTGEQVLHVCAEYGQLKLFEYFRYRGADCKAVNYVMLCQS